MSQAENAGRGGVRHGLFELTGKEKSEDTQNRHKRGKKAEKSKKCAAKNIFPKFSKKV